MSSRVHPDSGTAMGTPPVNGTGGERGTSALTADSEYYATGVLKPNVIPAEGPLRGTQYYNEGTKHRTGTSAVLSGPHPKTAQNPTGA